MADLLDVALGYAARGWLVFPLHSIAEGQCTCGVPNCTDAGKHPRVSNGVFAATADPAQIRKWWGPDAPPANIAIRTGSVSGITVLDIDIGEEKKGAETWADLINGHGEPQTLTAKTGSGGIHAFFKYNSALKTSSNTLGPGVDCRNDDGYVVAAPSRHRSGGTYTWEADAPLADLPAHLTRRKAPSGQRAQQPTKLTLAQARSMLAFIGAEDRDRWRHVGIILGREFDRADAAWALYNEWADKWGGEKGRGHDEIMREAFYKISQEGADAALTAASLTKWAKESGWENAEVKLMEGNELKAEAVEWLWEGHLARGKLHLIAGPPGTNKTTVAMALAATITQGGRWPDGTQAAKGSVLIWSGEDGVTDTLLPRLLAHQAERERLRFVMGRTDLLTGQTRAFDPAYDMDALALVAARIPDLALVIVDPVVLAIAGDSHKGAEVRRGLAPLVALAERTGAAAIGITHFSKNTDGRHPLERVTGSHAFGAAARIVFACAKLPGAERLFVRVKSNLGPDGGGFNFTVVPVEVEGCKTIQLLWGATLEGDARAIFRAAETPDAVAEEDEVVEWLRATIADAGGTMPRKEVMKAGAAAGYTKGKLERAHKRGKFQSTSAGFPAVATWKLPAAEHNAPPIAEGF